MFAASIFQVGGVTHGRNGIPFASFSERKPASGRLLLDQDLLRPIGVVRLSKSFLEHAELIDGLPGFRQVSAPCSTDRAAEPRDRLCLREWCFRNRKRRCLGPSRALERVADRYSRKGGVPAVTESCRKFGNAVARIHDSFRLLVLSQLQISVRQKVEGMVARGVFRRPGGGLRRDADRVSQGLVICRAVRTDYLLPHAKGGVDLRGHVQCVRRRKREPCAPRSSEHSPHGKPGIVVTMDDVVWDAWMVGVLYF